MMTTKPFIMTSMVSQSGPTNHTNKPAIQQMISRASLFALSFAIDVDKNFLVACTGAFEDDE